ncbi:cytochrome c biogenesis CcdA family protein [Chloroflexota bacterium]
MPENIPIIVAFSAGLLSFLSPCVLPMVPVYLASMVGPEILEVEGQRRHVTVFLHSVSFVIGFALVFTALGAIAGVTGYAISLSTALLNKIAGSVLIVFGLFVLAAQRVPWLNFERRLAPSLGSTTGYLRSFLIGAVFSLGWTACVGPVLGGILGLAMAQATAWQGAILLAIYSLGLGIPFLIIGVAFDSVRPLLKHLRRYSGIIYIVSGLLLIAVGILILTNRLVWLSSIVV